MSHDHVRAPSICNLLIILADPRNVEQYVTINSKLDIDKQIKGGRR